MSTRTERRTRMVPHTKFGKTSLIPEDYDVEIPIPPRDWDRIVLNGVWGITGIVIIASVTWSTASIGDFLTGAVQAAIAYGAASVFDAGWIVAMAFEWLARYDQDKARLPRAAGYVALAVAMAAITLHGERGGHLEVGLVGAAVSALAKGMWTVALKHTAKPLDEKSRKWLVQQRAEVGAALALTAEQLQLARAHSRLAAQMAALGMAPDTTLFVRPDGSMDFAPGHTDTTVRDAISTVPDVDQRAVAEYLASHGVHVGPDSDPMPTSGPDTQGPDPDNRSSQAVVRDIRPAGTDRVADTVRALLRDGIRDRDTVVTTVRATHGQHIPRDTVTKAMRRLDPTA